jgi:hypothetical protein
MGQEVLMSNPLCFARFRAERERQRARVLPFEPSGPRDPLTPAQRAHRFRMLSHLIRLRQSYDGKGIPLTGKTDVTAEMTAGTSE